MPAHDSAAAETMTFADLGLPGPLLAAVAELGFEHPTDIQAAAIPALLSGHDLCGIAQTGTGKTAAFGLPLLAQVDPDLGAVQALVLTPTRELAIQVSDALRTMAGPTGGLQVLPIYGGSSYVTQLRGLRAGAQVVVGTPGRVIDLIERGALELGGVRYLVLDEADEMLAMGFAEDVETILASTDAKQRQVAMFSATMPPAIRRVARDHLRSPVEVQTSRPSSTTATIEQTYAVVPARHKIGALTRVLATSDARATLVFVRTREDAEEIGLTLTARGIPAASISGDVPQRERERIVSRLRSGTVDVLVATDVAARGLDVDRIDLVINHDVPRQTGAYVHRIGRTGRAGRTGTALSFFSPRERGKLSAIERATGSSLTEVTIPTPAQVSKHRATAALATVPERISRGRLSMYGELIAEYIAEHDVDPLEAAAALLALTVDDDGPEPRTTSDAESGAGSRPAARGEDSEDLDASFETPRRGFEESRTGAQRPMHRRAPGATGRGTVYRVAVGHSHGARPEGIVGAITNEGGLLGSDLGKIQIFSRFSLVEVNAEVGSQAMQRLEGALVAGYPLRFRPDSGHPGNREHTGARKPERRAPRGRTPGGRPDRGDRFERGDRKAGVGAGRSARKPRHKKR